MARPNAFSGQFHERIFLDHLVLVVPPISGCDDGNRVRRLTLTRVRMPITDSNTAFTGMDSMVSLKAVRVSMSAFSAAVVVSCCATFVGMSPTAQGPGMVMTRCSGRWGSEDDTVGSWIVGHEVRAWSTTYYTRTAYPNSIRTVG